MQADPYEAFLAPVNAAFDGMVARLTRWCLINSGTGNLAGLETMLKALCADFASLSAKTEVIELSPYSAIDSKGRTVSRELGKAIRFVKRPEAKLKVLLAGHYDTVFNADHPFQNVKKIDDNTLNGPGVADLKGGLAIILQALQAFEASPFAANLGWEVLINPDEEIGSPGSTPLFEEAAKRCDLGLVFEPGYPDGTVVGERGGTGNFVVIARGRAAHVGRDPENGRSAILALSKAILKIESLNGTIPGVIVNVGHVEGGGASNVVPDLAIARINARHQNLDAANALAAELARIVAELGASDGITMELSGGFNRAPKDVSEKTLALFRHLEICAKEEGAVLKLMDKRAGGVCDGNTLAHAGLPNIDTLGVRGGHIHSDKEYALLDSLVERSRLTARFLMKMAAGEIKF